MQKDSERIEKTNFQEKIDLDYFFSGGGRAELLTQLQNAFVDGVSLLVFNGEDGSGKTVMCQMFEKRISTSCPVVNFSRTVESFEDVVKVVADKLGIESTEGEDGNGVNTTIERIARVLLERESKLLLIFDEAENIYLATLERIRKMLDQMNDAGVSLCVLFSGRPSFQENYDQLLICDFQSLAEQYFSLEPLTKDGTAEYLKCCIDKTETMAQVNIFTDEIVEKVYAVAKGNFRMTNLLAEESLSSQSDDTSFLVLLDSVADEEDEHTSDPKLSFVQKLQNLSPAILWASGAGCLFLLILLYFGSGEDESKDPFVEKNNVAATQQTPDDVKPVVVPQKIKVPVVSAKELPIQHKVDVVDPTPQSKEVVADSQENQDTEVVLEHQKVTLQPPIVIEPSPKPTLEVEVVEFRQSPFLKKRVGSSDSVQKGHINVQPRTEVQEVIASNAHFTPEQLYAKRVAAGKSWKRGAKDNMYTIQLMALTSKNAEENFKKMLAEKDYKQQATNFFIFTNSSSPSAILVYYGEYSTMSKARNARNSIPSFLQKHKPYAISIKGAVSKVKK